MTRCGPRLIQFIKKNLSITSDQPTIGTNHQRRIVQTSIFCDLGKSTNNPTVELFGNWQHLKCRTILRFTKRSNFRLRFKDVSTHSHLGTNNDVCPLFSSQSNPTLQLLSRWLAVPKVVYIESRPFFICALQCVTMIS